MKNVHLYDMIFASHDFSKVVFSSSASVAGGAAAKADFDEGEEAK